MLRAAATALFLLTLAPAFAADGVNAVIDRWYAALVDADPARLGALLADDATIELDDIGVTQTKAEFLDSMDEWKEAVSGAETRYNIVGAEGATTTVLACYDFPDNDLTMRETFRIENDLIVASTQTTANPDCAAF
jgi:hypothetical protein